MTGQDVINSALRLINALASGESPSSAESSDALEVLNDMIDSWNAQRLAIFSVVPQTFSLTAGQQAYTVGTGGNFNIQRPARIDRVSVISLYNAAQPLELPIALLTNEQWQAVPVKNITSALPVSVWDDHGFPLRTLSYFPIPSTQVQTKLYSWTPLSSFADLVTDYEFPPGYAKAIRYNLAVDLAPEFGVTQLNPLVVAQAQMALGVVKSMNAPLVDLYCDPALAPAGNKVFNWLTGEAMRALR
jgi:hypothetical protein